MRKKWFGKVLAGVLSLQLLIPAFQGDSRVSAAPIETGIVGDSYTISTLVQGMNSMNQMALDEARGYLYVTKGNTIQRIDLKNNNAITTVVGTEAGDYSPSGTIATEANISAPQGVTVAGDGTLYFTDSYNGLVRKVVNDQIVDVAGKTNENGPILLNFGDTATTDVQATATALFRPISITVDDDGNVYFTDNGFIYKVAQDGILTRLSPDNAATAISSMEVFDGQLYYTAFNEHVVRKIDLLTGAISAVAGTGDPWGLSGDGGPATAASLNRPNGVAIDGQGNVYIGETDNHKVRKVKQADGTIERVAGTGTYGYSGDSGPALLAQLGGPKDIAVADDGTVYVVDSINGAIRVLTPGPLSDQTLKPLTVGYAAGTQETRTVTLKRKGSGVLTNVSVALSDESRFTLTPPVATSLDDTTPSTTFTVKAKDGLSVGTYTATVTVSADSLTPVTFTVMQFVQALPKTVITIAGNGTYGYSGDDGPAISAELNYPEGVATDADGNVYIVDTDNNRIRKLDAVTKKISTVAGTGEPGYSGDGDLATLSQLNEPEAVVVDSDGNIFIADYGNQVIRKVGTDGKISTFAGTAEVYGYSGDNGLAADAQFDGPIALALDSDNNLYVADLYNARIRKIEATTGIITTIAGTGVPGFSGDDGPATEAQLNYPRGLALDSDNNVLIIDRDNHRIRKIDSESGVISTIAGTGSLGYSGDGGPANNAQLNEPRGIALDLEGNILIADKGNNRIRMIDAESGSIMTIAGTGNAGFSGDGGPATSAEFDSPYGVAVDSYGNVYFADKNNQRLRKLVDGLYTVTYDANASTEGDVPADGSIYDPGAAVNVLDNTGKLAKSGYTFAGWNTQADGRGTGYATGDSFAMGSSNVTLYAKWTMNPVIGGGSAPAPTKEVITVDVEDGSKDGSVVSKATIERTTDASGSKKDDVTFTNEQATKTAEQLEAAGSNTAKIVIPDAKDEVSELNVKLPESSTGTLASNGLNLEINTPNARVIIPNESLQGLDDDKYFRLVPIKAENERREVEERAKKETVVRMAAGTDKINVVGRPMTIETNMQSRKVTLVLPLGDVSLTDEELKDLGIFIEHSDGTKEFVKGEIVPYDATGKKGIRFTINKFSTFTIVHKEGWQQTALEGEGEAGKTHEPYIVGFPNGTFGPEKPITREEIAAILSRVLSKKETVAALAFKDVDAKRWSSEAIAKATKMGLLLGYEDGSFRPKMTITRAEMAAIVARIIEVKDGEKGQGFADVKAGHWAENAIKSVQAAELMRGYEDGAFRPNAELTRAEAVTLINRLLGRGPVTGIDAKWSDVTAKHWAFGDVQEASIGHRVENVTNGVEKGTKKSS
ncbi:S-layer homology domain-containing protein [Cohnella suwonensis]|uniref:S-layer homology domain-containing protein n=1 Tax=Cohnella suwonensis TaxID=696072 RepID=A0ABW0LS30_9BACL